MAGWVAAEGMGASRQLGSEYRELIRTELPSTTIHNVFKSHAHVNSAFSTVATKRECPEACWADREASE